MRIVPVVAISMVWIYAPVDHDCARRWSQSWRRMTGRLGNVRPISVNPAAANMANVPVNSADPLTLLAFNLSTSTG
jgi:hypothetical protein